MEKEEALSCFEYVFAGRTNKHHIMLGSFSTEDNVGLERSVLRNAKKTKNAAELSSSRSKHFSLFFRVLYLPWRPQLFSRLVTAHTRYFV